MCAQGPHDTAGLLTSGRWSKGALPRERHRATGVAWPPESSGFSLKCNSQLALTSHNKLENCGRCVCLWRREIECYRASKCISFSVYVCVLQTQDSLTVLIVAILYQVLVDRVGHLWLAVVPFHIHQQMVPFTLQDRNTESKWAGDKKESHTKKTLEIILFDQRHHKLDSRQTVMLCRHYDSHRQMPKSRQRPSQLKRDCRAFRALIK